MSASSRATGLLELARKHPNHQMHRSTVMHGFPIIMFYMVHEGDNEVGVGPHIEDMFLVSQEGIRLDGILDISDEELNRLEDEVLSGKPVKPRYKLRKPYNVTV